MILTFISGCTSENQSTHTYSSDDFGYSVTYSSYWTIDIKDNSTRSEFKLTTEKDTECSIEFIATNDNPENLDLTTWLKNNYAEGMLDGDKIMIDGVSGLKKDFGGFVMTVFSKDGKIYSIDQKFCYGNSLAEANSVIDSFRFAS